MRFKKDFFHNYLKYAPVPLALERTLECEILSREKFDHPILDIGCGEGLLAFILFDEKIDVGIDPNPKELQRAQAYNCYHSLLQAEGSYVPVSDLSFKTVFSNSVLEHIPDIDAVLQEISRLLSNDGHVYLTLPTHLFEQYSVINQCLMFLGLHSWASKYRRFFNRFWAHNHAYSPDEWTSLFEKHGFQVIKTVEYGSKTICLFNDFLVPLSLIGWVIKKITKQWTLFPHIRVITTIPIKLCINSNYIRMKGIHVKKGGLVFFILQKMHKATQ